MLSSCAASISDELLFPEPLLSLASLRRTAFAGRSLFAKAAIDEGTCLLSVATPFASTILDDFRKEACAICFHYDGSKLKTRLRHPAGNDDLVLRYFCSTTCRSAWSSKYGEVGIEAVATVEKLLVTLKSGRSEKTRKSENTPQLLGPASMQEVKQTWAEAQTQVDRIAGIRSSGQKLNAKASKTIPHLDVDDDPDTLRFMLDAILNRMVDDKRAGGLGWATLRRLVPSYAPYIVSNTGAALLQSHARMLQRLAMILPVEVLEFATSDTLLTLISRDSGNSFGIWCENGDAADRNYMIGYAIYPSASFFNHSCAPNVVKTRTGSRWTFSTLRNILASEELCISYLGGDERKPLHERREKLRIGWNFECACGKCVEEAGESEEDDTALDALNSAISEL